MEKWADYCISKLSHDASGRNISEVLVHDDKGATIATGEQRDRNWMVQKALAGKTFCAITKTGEGQWSKMSHFSYVNGGFNWDRTLPQLLTRRKLFVSYYHYGDQYYRDRFENLFGDLVVSKSVGDGDIDSDNSDEYIKQLIQRDYLADTTVLAILIGPKTRCRKHVDWETAGALNRKVGDNYAGLLGILLPTHPDFGKLPYYHATNLPTRLARNVDSGYALLIDWTEDRAKMQSHIEAAFARRSQTDKIINRAVPQMSENTCT